MGKSLLMVLAGTLVVCCLAGQVSAQGTEAKPKTHKKKLPKHRTVRHVVKGASAVAPGVSETPSKSPASTRAVHTHQVRAVLSPSDFPITLTAYDRLKKDEDASGTVLQISKNGYKTMKPEVLYTKDLDGEQISSIVSWHNTERSHFGFYVLTTPAGGNLYSVMFLEYHDGKLTVPIDEIATGYPVFPMIRKTDKTGQMQMEFYDGSGDATNDKIKTLVVYTWSDWSKKFVKSVHRVAAASATRSSTGKIEKTNAARESQN